MPDETSEKENELPVASVPTSVSVAAENTLLPLSRQRVTVGSTGIVSSPAVTVPDPSLSFQVAPETDSVLMRVKRFCVVVPETPVIAETVAVPCV